MPFIKSSRSSILSVNGRLKLEVVSDTHELNAFRAELPFKPSPVVTCLGIVLFVVDGTHDVCGREPPFVVILVPNSPHLAVIEKTYRLLVSHFLLRSINQDLDRLFVNYC